MAGEISQADFDRALIVVLVKEARANGAGYVGRTAIQKLCYFAQALGIPLRHRFKIYYYGPYSEAIADSLDSLVADEILVDASRDRERYSDFRLGVRADQYLWQHESDIQPYRPMIAPLVQAFGTLDPRRLELLSTLHFAHQRVKAAGMTQPSPSLVLDEFHRIKGDKFSDSEVEEGYTAMSDAKLLR